MIIFSANLTFAQDIDDYLNRFEMPSTPNPVGSGARALGIGGAFIAIADDATAASWNPGGLLQVEKPEVSIVFDSFHRIEENHYGIDPSADGPQTVTRGNFNYISATYPFKMMERDMVVSLNYQKLYDFTRKWDFSLCQTAEALTLKTLNDFNQQGSLSAVGVAYCTRIVMGFDVGLTFNFWNDGLNRWEQSTVQNGEGTEDGEHFITRSYDYHKYTFRGFNVNFGFLWRTLNDRLTIGGVVKTPFSADIDHENDYSSVIVFDEPIYDREPVTGYFHHKETLKMPLSLGIGIAYRITDTLTASLDIYRTEWDDFTWEDQNGNETSPITGKSASVSDISPTHQVRLGLEHIFIGPKTLFSLCGGVFYDPAPAENHPDDIYGFSLGAGFGYKRYNFNMAYQFRYGDNVGESILKDWAYSQDLNEHTIYSSLVIHF